MSRESPPRPRTPEASARQRSQDTELRPRREGLVEQQVHQDQAEPQVEGKVLWAVPNAPPCQEASLQIRAS